MESDQRLCRVYDHQRKHVQIVILSNLKLIKQNQLPYISTILDGLSRQSDTEANEDCGGFAEEGFIDACSYKLTLSSFATKRTKKDTRLSPSFQAAIHKTLVQGDR